jgi:uncharacterized protein (DUF608 family)/uncharacterized protein YycO
MKNIIIESLTLLIIIILIGSSVTQSLSLNLSNDIDILDTDIPIYSNSILNIPDYYFNLSKAPNIFTDRDNKHIKHFEEFNFPIGNFGNNYISYGPHGIDRIALYNNMFDSLGGSYGTGAYFPQCLDGTFLGIYCDDGEKKIAKILQKYPPTDRKAKDYGLEPIHKMECYSNIPIGYYRYEDAELSAELGLVVYSPLILYDLKNSTIPSSIWIFNAYNPTDEPIEVSFLFSLENDIGWRDKKNDDSTWQRTGSYNYIHETDKIIGVVSTYDENIMSKSRPEYLGDMTLATIKQPNVTISYTSEWDTLGDGRDLTYSFCNNGILNNKNISNRAIENEHIYAGALSAKIILEPGEGKNIPFVLSTFFPVFNLSKKVKPGLANQDVYKWYWTKYFNDSYSIASYSLENREKWLKEIELWQEKFYNSGLPPEMTTFLIGSLTSIVSDVFFSEDNLWFNTRWNFDSDISTYIDWFFCMFYPEIAKYCALQRSHIINENNGQYEPNHILHGELDFVIRSYHAWIWNQQDEVFLKNIYKSCKKAIEYTINKDVNFMGDCLIHNIGNDLRNDMWAMPLSSSLNSQWLLCLKCMISMAKQLNYNDDVDYFSYLFEKAQDSFIERFWFKGSGCKYFKLCDKKLGFWAWGEKQKPIPVPIRDSEACMIEQIVGVWHGKTMDQEILPLFTINKALKSIFNINRDYHHNLGWITSVMGNSPFYFIDKCGTYLYNVPNKITPYCQWSLSSSLLSYGFKEEAIKVASIAVENNLYKNGGVYFGDDDYVHLCGKNTRNKVDQCFKDKIKWKISWIFERFTGGGLSGSKAADLLGPPYPPRGMFDLPSWSFYQAAAGFTPCIGGIKIKPKISKDNSFYMCKFADCIIELNVSGWGDNIKTVKINGEPYHTIIDEQVFIPLAMFNNLSKMEISINLEDIDDPQTVVPGCVEIGDIFMMDIKVNSFRDNFWKLPGNYNEHIAIYAGDNKFINAHGTGVSKESYDYFINVFRNGCENHAFLRVKTATKEQKINAVKFAENLIGARYQNIFIPPWFGLKIADLNSNHPTANIWYCMEFVWAAYYNQGIDIDSNGWKHPKMVIGNEILKDDDIEVYLTII